MFSGLEFKFKVTFFTNRPAPAGSSLSFLPSVLSERKDPVYGGCDDKPTAIRIRDMVARMDSELEMEES